VAQLAENLHLLGKAQALAFAGERAVQHHLDGDRTPRRGLNGPIDGALAAAVKRTPFGIAGNLGR